MLRRILGMAAMRRMGPMGKAMIAAQLGSAAYAFYKQRKARRTGLSDGRRDDVGLDGAGRRRDPFNPLR